MKDVVFGQRARSVCVKDTSKKTPPSYLHVPALVVCAWHSTWRCYTISCGRYDRHCFLILIWCMKACGSTCLVLSQFMSLRIALSTASAGMICVLVVYAEKTKYWLGMVRSTANVLLEQEGYSLVQGCVCHLAGLVRSHISYIV
jgi:hypothetical protein